MVRGAAATHMDVGNTAACREHDRCALIVRAAMKLRARYGYLLSDIRYALLHTVPHERRHLIGAFQASIVFGTLMPK